MRQPGVALVTGASRNIGRAIAIRLAASGHPVAAVSRSFKEGLDATCAQIRANGDTGAAFLADVTVAEEVDRLVAEITDTLGPVSVLVHPVAVRPRQRFLDVTIEDWRRIMATNLDSMFLLCRAVIPMMLEQRWGRIIGFSGLAADTGRRSGGVVSASKMGVEGLVRSIAQEFAGSGITANVVLPGAFDTENKHPDTWNRPLPPVGRRGTVNEVAEACAYFVHPDASYTTGQTLRLTGGAH